MIRTPRIAQDGFNPMEATLLFIMGTTSGKENGFHDLTKHAAMMPTHDIYLVLAEEKKLTKRRILLRELFLRLEVGDRVTPVDYPQYTLSVASRQKSHRVRLNDFPGLYGPENIYLPDESGFPMKEAI